MLFSKKAEPPTEPFFVFKDFKIQRVDKEQWVRRSADVMQNPPPWQCNPRDRHVLSHAYDDINMNCSEGTRETSFALIIEIAKPIFRRRFGCHSRTRGADRIFFNNWSRSGPKIYLRGFDNGGALNPVTRRHPKKDKDHPCRILAMDVECYLKNKQVWTR